MINNVNDLLERVYILAEEMENFRRYLETTKEEPNGNLKTENTAPAIKRCFGCD